jgi:RNA polymerase sigma-70 factor (ECF subfamily)
MPPCRPDRLSAFLGKITRNIALDRYDARRAEKRSGNTELALDELGECIPDTAVGELSDEIALRDAINGFLRSLPARTRIIFLRRYFYVCSISDIAQSLGMSESNVKVTLLRTRKRLKEYLEKDGIII